MEKAIVKWPFRQGIRWGIEEYSNGHDAGNASIRFFGTKCDVP